MPDQPPPALVELLTGLRLATVEQVGAAHREVRRLAGELASLESAWVDALVQRQVLTPYQAAEINAGRGEQLLVDDYVIQARERQPIGWAQSFRAKQIGKQEVVHLFVQRGGPSQRCIEAKAQFDKLFEQLQGGIWPSQTTAPVANELSQTPGHRSLLRLLAAGATDDIIWAACQPAESIVSSDWLAWHGRMPPVVVLEIARQMAQAGACLERLGIVHGDIAASSLHLDQQGRIQLSRCGLRAIFRPDETRSFDELPIEAMNYLPPERIATDGVTAPTIQSDLYACGCLWWHLLSGRPPLAGGNHEEKLRALRSAKIPDIRRIAADAPPVLAQAIELCTKLEPHDRPQSFEAIVDLLGDSASAPRRQLATLLAATARSTQRVQLSHRVQKRLQTAASGVVATAICACLAVAAIWPLWRGHNSQAKNRVTAHQQVTAPHIVSLVAAPPPPTKGEFPGPEFVADSAVRRANYQSDDSAISSKKSQPSAPESEASVTKDAARPVIDLPVDRQIAGASLQFPRGALVRGRDGGRPRIVAPPGGMLVSADDVRFENIDFVWRQRPESITSPDRNAIVDVGAQRVTFVGCTFQAESAGEFDLPAAIRLRSVARQSALAPSSQVRLERCVLRGVDSGVQCASAGPALVEVRNSLHLGSGPLIAFSKDRGDEQANVILKKVTVRRSASVIELNVADASQTIPAITINASGCVFAPNSDGALLAIASHQPKPKQPTTLRSIEWTGTASLVAPDIPAVVWRHSGTNETLADDAIAIEGIVASAVEFNEPAAEPAASRLTRWLAPLESDESPGIGDDLPNIASIDAQEKTAHHATSHLDRK
jgi:eukaryotic-like serine/threonine-protein kinase